MSGDQDWTDNPRLNAWLSRQREAFPEWAARTGPGWDFSAESLDRLEQQLRTRFSSTTEVRAAQEDPSVSVPAWYLGEVQNRTYGSVWHANPVLPVGLPDQDGTPFVRMPEEPGDEYEEDELYEDENYVPGSNPFVEIRGLFVRGPDNRLRDVLDQYTR